jgi:hypothetical protein
MDRCCCYCGIEFGIKPKPGDKISHGVCRRHLIDQYIENDLKEYIREAEAASDHTFCPDMSQVYDG